jgi:hypothetical protein
MGKFYPSIPEDIQTWMLQQPVWFVASAPLAGKHVNVSPKGTYLYYFFAIKYLSFCSSSHCFVAENGLFIPQSVGL